MFNSTVQDSKISTSIYKWCCCRIIIYVAWNAWFLFAVQPSETPELFEGWCLFKDWWICVGSFWQSFRYPLSGLQAVPPRIARVCLFLTISTNGPPRVCAAEQANPFSFMEKHADGRQMHAATAKHSKTHYP